MTNINKILIAKEFAELGANQSFIMECIGLKRTLTENIIKEFGFGRNWGERILLSDVFLNDSNTKKEAELWWSTFERIDNDSKEEKMLSAYKLYRQLSSSPISINKCFGVIKAIENGIYIVLEDDESVFKVINNKDNGKLNKDDIEKNKDELHKLFDTQFLFN
jgi:hypothetical protein